MKRFLCTITAVLTLATSLALAASDDLTRVLDADKVPRDSRLGAPTTLDSYFPLTAPASFPKGRVPLEPVSSIHTCNVCCAQLGPGCARSTSSARDVHRIGNVGNFRSAALAVELVGSCGTGCGAGSRAAR